MKPFTLQSVLDYRKRLEDIAQHRLIEAKKIQETIRQRLRDEETTLVLLIEETERLQMEGIGITELIRYEDRITAQKSNIQAIEKNLSEKMKLVHKEQENLVHRSKEKQILERLKETQNKDWQIYLHKKEAAILDEIATTRHESDAY
ncbi:MAG: flagellar export protein FliJ [Desulforhopalus sp.]